MQSCLPNVCQSNGWVNEIVRMDGRRNGSEICVETQSSMKLIREKKLCQLGALLKYIYYIILRLISVKEKSLQRFLRDDILLPASLTILTLDCDDKNYERRAQKKLRKTNAGTVYNWIVLVTRQFPRAQIYYCQ